MTVSTFASDDLETAPAYWFLNALHILLAHNETGEGAYSLLHLTANPGFETPYHVHQSEDEAFYVLEGGVTVVHEGKTIETGPGGYIFLERGVPHGFRNSRDTTARLLIHAIPGGKVGFVGMMLELATSLPDRHKLPAATPPDLKQLAAACERNGISILGPLPA
jgi:quercetin dioxygenase-like cupin family protein